MASITEVARLAGVSIATVSRVVSAADYAVRPATRERVLHAARTLDYVPNALARGLLKSHVPVVGVIVHDITDPYFAEVVRGVEDAAAPRGYLVITCSSERDPERENAYVRLLRSIRAAAVIFAGSGLDDPVAQPGAAAPRQGDASVRRGRRAPVAARPGRAGDQRRQCRRHRRYGRRPRPPRAIAGSPSWPGPRRSTWHATGWRAIVAASTAAGLAFDERLVVTTTFDQDGGRLGTDALLAGRAPFTALCCANDLLALGALQRLGELGIDVPGAVSVIGFDDIGMAAMTTPSLSTVRLPLREMGRRGFEYADRVLAGKRPRRQLMPTTVVMRDSTAGPPWPPWPPTGSAA